jgi:hypothetical protein
MKKLEVHDSVAGSYLVVQVVGRDHYLDARMRRITDSFDDERALTLVEIVRNGQVYFRENIYNKDAPARIIELVKEKLLGN